jgi:hypothetical protein
LARNAASVKSKVCGFSRSTAISRLLSIARRTASSSVSATVAASGASWAFRARADSSPAVYRSTACLTRSSVRAASAEPDCAYAAPDTNNTKPADATNVLPTITNSMRTAL